MIFKYKKEISEQQKQCICETIINVIIDYFTKSM